MIRLFGFTIGKEGVVQQQPSSMPTFTLPTEALDDGAVTITSNAHYGTYVDLEGSVRNELELITRYREMANHPELNMAIDEIINEAITRDNFGKIVDINLDNLNQPESIKRKIIEEFDVILKMLNFKNLADELFKRWYIDGRLFYHIIVDEENPKNGIQELRYIDPRKIRKVREVNREKDPKTGAMIIKSLAEYYVYTDRGTVTQTYTASVNQGVRIALDSIINVNSGMMDAKNTFVISYLHSAIKPLNQLRMIEDAVVIYRLCLVGDTRVKTTTGWKYIKDINENDNVYSFYGPGLGLQETKVVKQWKTGTKQTYKVASKHFEITGSDNHPVLVLDRTTNIVEYVNIENIVPKKHCFVYEKPKEVFENIPFPKIRPLSVKLINSEIWSNCVIDDKEKYIKYISEEYQINHSSVRNFLYGQQYLNENDANQILDEIGLADIAILDKKYEGTFSKVIINLPDYIDEDFARLFGFMLGDGSLCKNGLKFAEGVQEDQNLYYASLLAKYFGSCKRYPCKNRKYVNYITCNKFAAELFKELGFVTGANNKRIPEWLYHCSDSIKKQFILGFCDADGCNKDSIYTGTWSSEIEIHNKQLIEDIKEIWTSIGLTSGKIKYRKRPAKERIVGDELTPRIMPESESWYVRISDYELPKFEPIYEVVPAEIEDVYELEVASEKHNFVANGVIVHNSRAPERRIFYIDVGNLPKGKAEQYLRDVMVKYRNKMVYDACLAMDTKIPLLDGRELTLSEITDEFNKGERLWAYSCDPDTGKFSPGLISWAGVTKKDQTVMKITLNNGSSIICTPDHKHVTKHSGLVETRKLIIGEYLMPWYTSKRQKYLELEYNPLIYKNDDKRWEYVSELVAQWKDTKGLENGVDFNERLKFKSKQLIIHKDNDRFNNNPENLYRVNNDYYENLSKDELPRVYEWKGDAGRNSFIEYQSIEFPDYIYDMVEICAEKNLNITTTILIINRNINPSDWTKLNNNKKIRNLKTFSVFTKKQLTIVCKRLGFKNFKELKQSFKFNNPRIVNIEYLSETMDVGTLSIDNEELYTDNHTFALSAGIYTKNSTGEMRDDRKHLSMLEDFWLPRREGGKGTEITTLPAGQNLGEIEDVVYFRKNLLNSLNVPISRLEPQDGGMIGVGRTTEVTRDEVKFSKFIQRLRSKFSRIFDDALGVQLALKGICTKEEWEDFKEDVYYQYKKDNNFTELRDAELLRERLTTLSMIEPYLGKYWDIKWARKNICQQDDELQEKIDEQIAFEQANGITSVTQDQQQLQMNQMNQMNPEDYSPINNVSDGDEYESQTPGLDSQIDKYSNKMNKTGETK